MYRRPTAVLSAATIVAALGLSGCSGDERGASPATEPPTSAPMTPTANAQTAPLPTPDALTGVLYRLADPGVPGAAKLNLVEGATADNAAVIDQFATALLNGGYAPMKFDARDLGWSDRDPANVVATVDVSSPTPGVAKFSFPMEFKPYQQGWQLSARTAEMLLAFSPAQVAPPATPGH